MKFFTSAVVLALVASSQAFLFGSSGGSGGCGCAAPAAPACGPPPCGAAPSGCGAAPSGCGGGSSYAAPAAPQGYAQPQGGYQQGPQQGGGYQQAPQQQYQQAAPAYATGK
uniref:Uncharacterized protein n=1 Tax=Rhabditophanes sp. KR3021 TaxID=114890 RepID=A0AC35TKG0_9BILA